MTSKDSGTLISLKAKIDGLHHDFSYGDCNVCGLSYDNRLSTTGGGWVVMSPGKWGNENDFDVDAFCNALAGVIKSTTEDPSREFFIDIMNLGGFSEGIRGKLRNAFWELFQRCAGGGTIRYLEGAPPTQEEIDGKPRPFKRPFAEWLKDLDSDNNNRKFKNIKVYEGQLRFPAVSQENIDTVRTVIGTIQSVTGKVLVAESEVDRCLYLLGRMGPWIHAKGIAVNGDVAVTGGHNLWDDYITCSAKPGIMPKTSDLSMRVEGGAAADMQRFADFFWRYLNKPEMNGVADMWIWDDNRGVRPIADGERKRGYENAPLFETWYNDAKNRRRHESADGVPVLAVGKVGGFDLWELLNDLVQTIALRMGSTMPNLARFFPDPFGTARSASRIARTHLIEQANSSIFISQQKIGLPGGEIKADLLGTLWPVDMIDALASAIKRGVEVRIVTSPQPPSTMNGKGYEEYFSDATPGDLQAILKAALMRLDTSLTYKRADELLQQHLQMRQISYVADKKLPYAEGKLVCNHGKFLMVDKKTFYIGSDNAYPSWLIEFGYVVDHDASAKHLIEKYWDEIWKNSAPTWTSGTTGSAGP
jgi:phosphatidylserine/phosphatidylglycerophosphate/cardiolipin synthase-like enzyme